MKFVSYLEGDQVRPGLVDGDTVLELDAPGLLHLLQAGALDRAPGLATGVRHRLDGVGLAAPLPAPPSFRDFYAFEQHIKTTRANRGLPMIAEWYELPVFFFGNHQSIIGPEAEVKRPALTRCLDYELEIGCVIGRSGMDIPAAEAEAYIAGFTVLNDWSARDIQRKEMKVQLGPAKGKDFATSLGPYLVTLDELADRRIPGPRGARWNLAMTARVNGREYSRGNFADIFWTCAQQIEWASAGARLYPGDVLGSGTVGTGCILELGDQYPWLEPGDVVELEVERLGVLRNRVA